jgi:DNA-binding CsgD family transcriptional regulator
VSKKFNIRQRPEIIRYIAAGCSNKEIGYRLGLSENTVKAYVSWVLLDTGCNSRTELAEHYWRTMVANVLRTRDQQWRETITAKLPVQTADSIKHFFDNRYGNDYEAILRSEREAEGKNGAVAHQPESEPSPVD